MITKLLIGLTLIAIFAAFGFSGNESSEEDAGAGGEDKYAWEFSDVNAERAENNRPYISFMNVDSMHCGIYHLKAGSKDGQSPHSEDEVYYVESGIGKFHMDGQEFDVKPGTILFVPANKTHYFHEIEEDLNLLVFFSKAKP